MAISPGTIIVASGDLARYPGFTVSLLHLLRPPGTEWRFQVGLNVAASLNQGIRDMTGEWVWIMGDDHILPPDTLARLLQHNKDVIVPVCVRRKPPFVPVIFKEPREGDPEWKFPPWKWSELPASGGVHRIHVAGSAGMLIRRHVLEKVGDPWFEVGQQDSQQLNEDSYFCTKLAKLGIPPTSERLRPPQFGPSPGHPPGCRWPRSRPQIAAQAPTGPHHRDQCRRSHRRGRRSGCGHPAAGPWKASWDQSADPQTFPEN